MTANETDPNTANNSATQTTMVLDTVQFSATAYSAGREPAETVLGDGHALGHRRRFRSTMLTGNNTASAGSDYTATSGTLFFAAGEASKTIGVPITADSTPEGNEALNLTLSSPVGALIGRNSSASLTILDDDVYTPPTLDFSAVRLYRGRSHGHEVHDRDAHRGQRPAR